MIFAPELLETGHTPGVPADTVHRAAHKLNANLAAIESAFTGLGSVYREITIDGGGNEITAGSQELWYRVPFDMVFHSWHLLGWPQGSIELDVRVIQTFADFPAADIKTICGGNPPLLATAKEAEDDVLEGWTTSLYTGQILCFPVISVDLVQRITLSLEFRR